MTERWAPISGWEGLYSASDRGRIRSETRHVVSRWGGLKIVRSRILASGRSGSGYLHVTLAREGAAYRVSVHRLVLEAFVGPCPPGMECRHHPDNCRTNNRLENLSWGTHSQNMRDRAPFRRRKKSTPRRL